MISSSNKLFHPRTHRDEDYNYRPVEGEKHAYGKATQKFFKPVELTEQLLLTPNIALCMATFYADKQLNKNKKEYKAFSRSDKNVRSIAEWMCFDLDDGLPKDLNLESYTYFITTTQNHGVLYGDRYKLFIRTNLTFTKETLQYYKSAYQEVAKQLHIDNFDPSCTDISRLIAPLALEDTTATIYSKAVGDKDFTHLDITQLAPYINSNKTSVAVVSTHSLSKLTTSHKASISLNKTATTAFISQGMYPDDNNNLHHTLDYITNPKLRPQEPIQLAESRAVMANPLLYKELQKLSDSLIERHGRLDALALIDDIKGADKTKLAKAQEQERNYKALKQEFKLAVDAERLSHGDQAFQPLQIVEEGNRLIARSQGQHARNTQCSLVMSIDIKSVSEIKPYHTEVLTTEKGTYYYDSKKMQLITRVEQDLRFFPDDLYSPTNVIASFADLYRVGDAMYMLEQTQELIEARDLLPILEVQYGDILLLGYDEEGNPIRASHTRYAPSVMKFINEELPANRMVNGVRTLHTYLPPRTYIDADNFYIIQKPLTLPKEPKQPLIPEIETRLLEKFPDLDATIRMAVLGGFRADGKFSKTFITVLQAISDAGKNKLLTSAFSRLGLVKSMERKNFVDTFIENGPGGTDPKQLEGALIVLINEVNSSPSTEEKLMDSLKDAHDVGLSGRTLHAKNVHLVFNQVWLVAAQRLSFATDPHFEHATRMTNFRWLDNVVLPDTKLMQGYDLDTQVMPSLMRLIYNVWLDEYTECKGLNTIDLNKRASVISYNMEARAEFLKSSKAVEIKSIIEMAGIAISDYSMEEIADMKQLPQSAPNQQRPYYELAKLSRIEEDNTSLLLSADFRIAFKNRGALGVYLENGGNIGKNSAKNILDKLKEVSENNRTKTFGGKPIKCLGILSLDRDTYLDPKATDKIRAAYPDIADAYAIYDKNRATITAEQWTKLVKYYIEESDKVVQVVEIEQGGLDV